MKQQGRRTKKHRRKAGSESERQLSKTGLSTPRPFLKWVGGKKQLLPILTDRMPKRYRNYFEPFIGGGALYFKLQPRNARISDINPELINCYEVIRDDVEGLIRDLKRHRYERNYFYKIRSLDRSPQFGRLSALKRASRLIFLNKTCFNGLYRVNSKGQFNSPFGDYRDPRIVDAENLRACSALLKKARISCAPYWTVEQQAKKGDFVYFDPPYAPLSATANFTSYSQSGFGPADQQALRDLCRRLDRKGVYFALSNSSAPLILSLYKEFSCELIDASRAINSKGGGRGKVKEVLVTNY